MTTMHDAAVRWVKSHQALCTNPSCDCSTGDGDRMVDALLALWLGMEPGDGDLS